jgi:hypothetical protein
VSRRAYRLYWRIDYETLKSKNADTENISSRKRSRFPPFEKRKGWGTLSCDDIGTERMGHPSNLIGFGYDPKNGFHVNVGNSIHIPLWPWP